MKQAHRASHIALQKARRDHAAAIQTQNASKVALEEVIQKARQRYAAASEAAAAALLDVEAKEVVEAKANAKLQLAQRAVKRERDAADARACPEFKKR